MTTNCNTCKHIHHSNRAMNINGKFAIVPVSECNHPDSSASNNNHAPSCAFARNKHYGVCSEQGILYEEKKVTEKVFVDYHAKRMVARANAWNQLETTSSTLTRIK